MIWRNLWRRKLRSLLTMLGVAIGVAAVITLGAMAEGLSEGYGIFASGSSADLLVTQSDASDLTVSTLDSQVGDRIRQLAGVRNVSGVIFNLIQMEGIPFFSIGGYAPDEVAIEHFKVIQGQPLEREKEIILGRQAAHNLNKSIGDTIKLYGIPFRVVGIFETGHSIEEGGAIISLADAQAIFRKQHQVSFFEVQIHDPQRIDEVQARIGQLLKDVSVSEASDISEYQSMARLFGGTAWGISFVALLIGGLVMLNTMLMAVFEQTREIGILRAIGWRRNRVLGLALCQSLLLSTLGGLLGVSLGLGLVWLVNRTPAVSSFAPGIVQVPLLLRGTSAAVLLGLLGGFYPAWRAANLSPVEALCYDSGAGAEHGPAWAQSLGITFRNLLRRRVRTLLTIGGIAIGLGLTVSMGAIVEGMIHEMTVLVSQGDAELVAMQAGVTNVGVSVIEERVGRAIAAMPEVEYVSGVIWSANSDENMGFMFIFGLEPNGRSMQHFRVIDGDPVSGRGEIMLGRTAADTFNKQVGDAMKLRGGVFRVTGIYETGLAYEEGGGVVSLTDAQAAFQKPRQVTMIRIKLRDPSQAETVRAKIEERFSQDVSVSMASNFVEETANIRSTQAMLGAIFALAILVGSVAVINTMVMAVLERTREIGTLRALGWRQWQVLWMILSESLLMCLVAAGAGVLIGLVITLGLRAVPGIGTSFKSLYTPQLIAQAIAVALFLGAVGGLYPAWYASRLRPVEALRYE